MIVSSVGDFNNDSYDDFIIGITSGSYVYNKVYMVYGSVKNFASSSPTHSPTLSPTMPSNSPSSIPSLSPTLNPTILPTSVINLSEENFKGFESSVGVRGFTNVGDVNKDGFEDLFIQLQTNNNTKNTIVAGYLLFGKSSGLLNNAINDIDAGLAVKFTHSTGSYPSFSVSPIGDYNQDGFPDFAIGGSDLKPHYFLILLLLLDSNVYCSPFN